MKLWVKFLPVFLIISPISPSFVSARSGCCSHHGGVCGCKCCGGSPLSVKCAPYYPNCNSAPVVQKVYPTSTLKPVYSTKIPTRPPSNTSNQSILGTEDESLTENNGSTIGGLAMAGGGYMGYKLLKKSKGKEN